MIEPEVSEERHQHRSVLDVNLSNPTQHLHLTKNVVGREDLDFAKRADSFSPRECVKIRLQYQVTNYANHVDWD